MSESARGRVVVGVVLAAALGVLGLAGCARIGGSEERAADTAEMTELSWDAQALESIGFGTAELAPVAVVTEASSSPTPGANPGATPGAQPGAQPGDRRGHPRRPFKRMRFGFGARMLHGEAVVSTEDGTKTVVVQRGEVTAVDGASITVRSPDGFVLTWRLGDQLRVIEHRAKASPSAITVGDKVGVAGAKDGSTPVARLVLIPEAESK